ncbi:Response regulator receiver domain-containing protein [Salipiger thiooxidans]|uniref:Response regulator receiver domain-containing protein n=2 Tax=Salipiger thiooxidans TaxID=282683 RepID=A0A1G7AK13_9RHOB|nr:Response regulator receiver domain-containing protein [Salipiger thiooxidans]
MTAIGHEVMTARSADEALELLIAEDGAFDFVSLDVVMDNGGAISPLHRIRDRRDALPVVIITGRAEIVNSPLFVNGLQLAQRRVRKSTKLRDLADPVKALVGTCGRHRPRTDGGPALSRAAGAADHRARQHPS